LILSMSCVLILSTLSELLAARIVIPFKIVTTSSVFNDVVKKVFKLASFWFSFCLRDDLPVILDITLPSFYLSKRSLILDIAMKKPDSKTMEFKKVTNYSTTVSYSVGPIQLVPPT